MDIFRIVMPNAARNYDAFKSVTKGSEHFCVEANLQQNHEISNSFYEMGLDLLSVAQTNRVILYNLKVKGKQMIGGHPTPKYDVDFLIETATPAPFGKGDQTVLDPSVRLALEIKAADIEYRLEDYAVRRFLGEFTPKCKKLVPKLYKMHIYQTGGFFLDHKDTLHANNHYATMILALPRAHEGGELVLKDGVKETVIPMKDNVLVMFHTDVTHSVKPVTSGTRVVLQFDVYIEDEDIQEIELSECIFTKDPVKELAISDGKPDLVRKVTAASNLAMNVKAFLEEHPDDSIHFLLTHKYPLGVALDGLKGSDRALVDTLSKDYDLSFGLAICSYEYEEEGDFDNDNRKYIKLFTTDGVRQFKRYVDLGILAIMPETGKHHLFFGNGAKFDLIESTYYVEHMGNESQTGECAYRSMIISLVSKV